MVIETERKFNSIQPQTLAASDLTLCQVHLPLHMQSYYEHAYDNYKNQTKKQ